MVISRRSVLNGIGQSTALGAIVAALSPHLRAAQVAAPAQTLCLSMIYRQAEGASFNGDAFRDKHLPLLRKVYANSVDRIELRMAAPVPEGQPVQPILATVNIWFRDINQFVARTQAGAKDVSASMATITAAPVSAQVDQVVVSLGEPMASVPVDGFCYSSWFQDKDGGTFDARYFSETYYPKLAEIYGTDAIRRIEIATGAAPASGGKLLMKSAVHVYIKDEAAYDQAVTKVPPELFAEAKQYTNIVPLQTLTKLHAAG
jgi:hypothetical protein